MTETRQTKGERRRKSDRKAGNGERREKRGEVQRRGKKQRDRKGKKEERFYNQMHVECIPNLDPVVLLL